MREVAQTVCEAGLEPLLSVAIAERQDWAWERGQEMGQEGRAARDLGALLDALAAAAGGRRA